MIRAAWETSERTIFFDEPLEWEDDYELIDEDSDDDACETSDSDSDDDGVITFNPDPVTDEDKENEPQLRSFPKPNPSNPLPRLRHQSQ